jgi:branched-chain amino acid transport system substrate-binding protein
MKVLTRWVSVVLCALLLAGLAAACAPAAPTGEEAPAETTAMATEGECADPLGCVDIAAGAPIKLAYMLVVAGSDQALGIDSRRGVELAMDDVPEVLGHPVELIGEDSACTAEGGQAAATKLAADKTIVAVIGTSCSSEARAGAPIISDAGLTMVSPSNTAPDLTDPEKHVAGYLRTAHNDKVQGKVAAEFVAGELGLTKVATIHDGSPYSEGLVNAFEENFQALGGEITAHEAVGPEDTDMRPVLTTIAATNPELLYFPVFTKAGGFIATQSKEVSGLENVQGLMGADGLFSPDFIKAAGPAAVGMYLSSPDFSAFGSAYKDAFLPAHEAKYGEPPISAFHAHAYDAYNMILAAVAAVAQEQPDGSLQIGRQALRDALFATRDFQGLTGNVTCNATGDCADPRIAVYRLTEDNVTSERTPTEKIYPLGEAGETTSGGTVPAATGEAPLAEATATTATP